MQWSLTFEKSNGISFNMKNLTTEVCVEFFLIMSSTILQV
jgi:hypothetical protein